MDSLPYYVGSSTVTHYVSDRLKTRLQATVCATISTTTINRDTIDCRLMRGYAVLFRLVSTWKTARRTARYV